MKIYRFFPLLFIGLLTLLSCTHKLTAEGQVESSFTIDQVPLVKEQMLPLDEHHLSYKKETLDFFHHYGADQVPGSLEFAWFQSGEQKMASYLFRPAVESPKGTVYLLHGYLDHTLSNSKLIKFLVEQEYNVAAFDMAGHGFSGGDSVDIDDFSEYAYCFKRFKNLTEESLDGPYFALGHSTGSSVILEYLNLYPNDFTALILASPLLKAVGWRITPLVLALASPFTDEVGRRFGGSSSNKEHEDFKEYNDPLQSRTIPFNWVYASMNWSDRMELIPPREDLSLYILQGKKDRTVDYRQNISLLMEKYTRSDVIYYEEGKHSLFNELSPIRDKVFQDILQILEKDS
jgi:alpha-beta hydrolase superfamily lysophospholipase